eukprot:261668-Alexandrium_andersonii.AAC.1
MIPEANTNNANGAVVRNWLTAGRPAELGCATSAFGGKLRPESQGEADRPARLACHPQDPKVWKHWHWESRGASGNISSCWEMGGCRRLLGIAGGAGNSWGPQGSNWVGNRWE